MKGDDLAALTSFLLSSLLFLNSLIESVYDVSYLVATWFDDMNVYVLDVRLFIVL